MVEFFIDSADRPRVTEMLSTGLFAGVTTNPAILERSGLGSADLPDFVAWAEDAGARRIFVQTWGPTARALVERGQALRALSPRVVVKVPYAPHGLAAARALSEGGGVLVTALHRASQATAVAATGAAYTALFVSRIDATGRSGISEAVLAQRSLRASGSDTRVMAGSLRTPDQILELAAEGVSAVTIGPAVWDAFFDDEHTRAAVERFEQLADPSASAAALG